MQTSKQALEKCQQNHLQKTSPHYSQLQEIRFQRTRADSFSLSKRERCQDIPQFLFKKLDKNSFLVLRNNKKSHLLNSVYFK